MTEKGKHLRKPNKMHCLIVENNAIKKKGEKFFALSTTTYNLIECSVKKITVSSSWTSWGGYNIKEYLYFIKPSYSAERHKVCRPIHFCSLIKVWCDAVKWQDNMSQRWGLIGWIMALGIRHMRSGNAYSIEVLYLLMNLKKKERKIRTILNLWIFLVYI